jgi:hypothetical protein
MNLQNLINIHRLTWAPKSKWAGLFLNKNLKNLNSSQFVNFFFFQLVINEYKIIMQFKIKSSKAFISLNGKWKEP